MPVESVELVHSHHVEISHYLGLVEEVTRNVHMQTAVFESRCIVYLHARKVPVLVCSGHLSVNLYRKHLLQSLHSVVEAAESGSLYSDTLLGDSDCVCLVRNFCVKHERETVSGLAFIYGAFDACHKSELLCERVEQSL